MYRMAFKRKVAELDLSTKKASKTTCAICDEVLGEKRYDSLGLYDGDICAECNKIVMPTAREVHRSLQQEYKKKTGRDIWSSFETKSLIKKQKHKREMASQK